jgi:hypothetical protein
VVNWLKLALIKTCSAGGIGFPTLMTLASTSADHAGTAR